MSGTMRGAVGEHCMFLTKASKVGVAGLGGEGIGRDDSIRSLTILKGSIRFCAILDGSRRVPGGVHERCIPSATTRGEW